MLATKMTNRSACADVSSGRGGGRRHTRHAQRPRRKYLGERSLPQPSGIEDSERDSFIRACAAEFEQEPDASAPQCRERGVCRGAFPKNARSAPGVCSVFAYAHRHLRTGGGRWIGEEDEFA